MGDSTTGSDTDWVTGIVWGSCPGWCTRNPDPNVDLAAGGHMIDLQDGGTAVRYHDHRWALPDAEAPEAVEAIELEAIETCPRTGKPELGEVRFLVNTDNGQYMSMAAAAAASTIIKQALADMAAR